MRIQEAGEDAYQQLTYNSEGYLVRAASYRNSVVEQTYTLAYTAGNLTGFNLRFDDPAYKKNGVLAYGTGVSSPRLIYISPLYREIVDFFVPVEYLGRQSKGLLVSYTYTDEKNAHKSIYQTTYAYTSDGAGNIMSAVVKDTGNHYNNGQIIPGTASGLTTTYQFDFGCR